MTRGRKPLPSHLKLVRGNPGRRALNHDEPNVTKAIPEMPLMVKKDRYAREEWVAIAPKLKAAGY